LGVFCPSDFGNGFRGHSREGKRAKIDYSFQVAYVRAKGQENVSHSANRHKIYGKKVAGKINLSIFAAFLQYKYNNNSNLKHY